MSEVAKRVWKRRRYPVVLGEGDGAETLHVRSLTFAELEALDTITDGLMKTFFMVGVGFVDANGDQVYPKVDGETPDQYAARIKAECVDIPSDTLHELGAAIAKIEKTPKHGTIVKN